MSDSFDVVVIGAGPGGYVCAIRAAQLGKRVAIIEKRDASNKRGPKLGGTCLNVGCIPSKALLDSSEHFHNATHSFASHGINVGEPSIDVPQMMKRKSKVVTELTGGIAFLMKKNKITVLSGTGTLTANKTVMVAPADGSDAQEISAGSIVLATGSLPIELPFIPFDGDVVGSSDQAIAYDTVPKHLIVVGGGVIGLELSSVWARLGAQVTVVEFLDQVAATFDPEGSKSLQKSLQKLGITFLLKTKVTKAEIAHGSATITAEGPDGELTLTGDKVLVAVGRRPVTESVGLDTAGVELDDRKRVKVDAHFQTNVPGIYAIGDLIHGPMLAHKAEEDGVAVAEIIAGHKGHVDYDLVPGVVYTWPELADIGMTEQAAKDAGHELAIGRFQFMANGRAKASADTDGFVKIIADKQTDKLLGCTIVGARASDLIMEAATIMAFGGSAEDLALICHAHPTFSEAVKEAALDSQGRMIHS